MAGFNEWITSLSETNPLRAGGASDVLSLIPFVILVIVLYLTGRERILAPKRAP
jgi:hypothetical protein